MTSNEAAHINQLKQGWFDALYGATRTHDWAGVYAVMRTMEAINFKELVNEQETKL